MCSIPFENKGVEFINTDHILRIVKPLPSSSVKFPMPMVTYKWTTARGIELQEKEAQKRLKHTGNLIWKNLKLKDVC